MPSRFDSQTTLTTLDRVLEFAVRDLSRMEDEQERFFPIRSRLEKLIGMKPAQVAAFIGGPSALDRFGDRLVNNFGLVEAGYSFRHLAGAVRAGEVIPSIFDPDRYPGDSISLADKESIHGRLNDLFFAELPNNPRFYGAAQSAIAYLEQINPGSRRISEVTEKIRTLDRMDSEMMLETYGAKDLLAFSEMVLHEFGMLELRNQIRSVVLSHAKHSGTGEAA